MQKNYKIFTFIIIGTAFIGIVVGAAYLADDGSTHAVPSQNGTPANESVKYGDFAFSFYHQIAKDDSTSNLFFSPFSISTAFSMAYEGREEIPQNRLEKHLVLYKMTTYAEKAYPIQCRD